MKMAVADWPSCPQICVVVGERGDRVRLKLQEGVANTNTLLPNTPIFEFHTVKEVDTQLTFTHTCGGAGHLQLGRAFRGLRTRMDWLHRHHLYVGVYIYVCVWVGQKE